MYVLCNFYTLKTLIIKNKYFTVLHIKNVSRCFTFKIPHKMFHVKHFMRVKMISLYNFYTPKTLNSKNPRFTHISHFIKQYFLKFKIT